MARRKSLIRLPFFKFKINKQTIFNILGFFIIGFSAISLISFSDNLANENSGILLYRLKLFLIAKFGGLAVFLPFLLVLFATHFFNTKKLKFIKPNISIGVLMIYIALLGVLRTGDFGEMIFENLALDFSVLGALVILLIIFIIGLVLFLDTSIDIFVIFIFNLLKSAFIFLKNYLFRNIKDKPLIKPEKKELPMIVDEKIKEKQKNLPLFSQPVISKPKESTTSSELINIKPLPLSSKKDTWIYPPLSLLTDIDQKEADRGDVKRNAAIIEETLDSFGVRAKVEEINFGPAVTQYAISIPMGTKLSKVTALANNLALSLAASTGQVRIEAPIPGRSLVGIE
ncbi:MAG: DNA translocase FtsK, partial [Microgenomates group bacterium]